MTFVYSDDVSKTMVDQFRTWQRSDQPPSLIVASTGLRLLRTRNTTTSLLEEYQRNLTRLVQAIDSLAARNTQVLWKLMEPVDAEKLKNENKKITNANIDAYNRAAVQILTHSAAKVWESARLMWSAAQSPEGAALGGTALRHSAQVLLNMFCNDHMNFNDGSCCAQPEPHSQLQVLTFAVFFACFSRPEERVALVADRAAAAGGLRPREPAAAPQRGALAAGRHCKARHDHVVLLFVRQN